MVNYRYVKARFKPTIFHTQKELKTGTWVPLSIAGQLCNYTVQNLRLLCYQGSIKSAKFDVGPLLVQIESVLDYKETIGINDI